MSPSSAATLSSDAKNVASGSSTSVDAGDVGRDGRQHVIAGEQHPLLRVVEAEVIGRVPGRVDGEPVSAAEANRFVVGHADGGLGPAESGGGHRRPSRSTAGLLRRAVAPAAYPTVSVRTSRTFASTARRVRPRRRRAESRSKSSLVSETSDRNDSWVRTSAPASSLSWSAPPKWSGWEWVTIVVWTPPQRNPGGLQPLHQRRPGLGPGEAGVDERESRLVLEGIGVDVAEPGHRDGELHPEYAGRDLDHLFGGRLLLLLRIDGFGHPGTLLGRRRTHEKRGAIMTKLVEALADVVERSMAGRLLRRRAKASGCHRRASSLSVETSTER